MKHYKDFPRWCIGSSDYATLILAGCGNTHVSELKFGEDGSYYAYVINTADVKIGGHYAKVAEFETWMKIYDDQGLTCEFKADKIEVFRAGNMGCIIRFTNKAR